MLADTLLSREEEFGALLVHLVWDVVQVTGEWRGKVAGREEGTMDE